MTEEIKTLSRWVEDPRIPFQKHYLWLAIKAGKLKAHRPIGAKKWLLKWSDLEAFMEGRPNG